MKTSVFKKATALVLVFMMMFSMAVTAVSATDAATLTVKADAEAYKAGDIVTVTVSASNLTAQALGLSVSYDEALEFVSAEWTVEGAVMKDFDADNMRAVMTLEGDAAIEGAIFSLVFTVKADTVDGDYAVTVVPFAKDVAGDDVACAEGAATVVVINKVECDHKYDNDCDADCNLCGDTREVADHNYETKYDELSHWKECSICKGKIEVAEHVFDNDCDTDCACGFTRDIEHEWETKYDANGHWTECACGEKTEVTAHELTWEETTAATDTSNGVSTGTCVCGYTTTKVIPAIMKFASASLVLESSITMNFKVKPEYFEKYGYTNHYVIFTLNGKETRVDEYKTEGSGSSKRYVFEFKGVSSYMVSYQVEAVLYAEYDGELYAGTPQPYSAKQYCYNQLSKTTDTKFRTLLVNLLNYGTAAQQRWGHSLDDLANAELTETQKSWGTYGAREYANVTATDYEVVEGATGEWKAAGLILDSAVVIRPRFEVDDIEGVTVKVTSNRGREWIVAEEDISWNGTRYEFYFNSLMAYEWSDEVYFTMYKDGVAISNTLRYSVESYVARNYTSASDGAVILGMINYGDAAKAYFNK